MKMEQTKEEVNISIDSDQDRSLKHLMMRRSSFDIHQQSYIIGGRADWVENQVLGQYKTIHKK